MSSPYAPDGALYPSPDLYPSATLYPSGPTAADRVRAAVGDDARARLMWDAAFASFGMGLGGSLAGMAHQPTSAWTLAGGAIAFAWGRREWSRTRGE